MLRQLHTLPAAQQAAERPASGAADDLRARQAVEGQPADDPGQAGGTASTGEPTRSGGEVCSCSAAAAAHAGDAPLANGGCNPMAVANCTTGAAASAGSGVAAAAAPAPGSGIQDSAGSSASISDGVSDGSSDVSEAAEDDEAALPTGGTDGSGTTCSRVPPPHAFEYHILHSAAYSVPVLFFRGSDAGASASVVLFKRIQFQIGAVLYEVSRSA